MKHFAIDGKHSMIDLPALNCPHFFSCQSAPSAWSSVTAFFNALYKHSSSILCPVFWRPGFETCEGTGFLAAEVPAWLACTELSELLMTVYLSIGSLQLDLVHLHYYKETNSNIVKIKEKRPFSVYSDSEKTPSSNFPIRWTWSMNKK